MNNFFTSDMHFWHKNIFKYCPKTRSGKSVEEMNQRMIENWCSQVTEHDTVYHLGDFSFNKDHNEALNLIASLPGRSKVFVRGNHDYSRFWTELPKLPNVSTYDYLEVFIGGTPVVMFHYPIIDWNKRHRGAYHLFGHEHGGLQVHGRAMDVGIDARPTGDMKLWTWSEIHTKLSKLKVLPHHGGEGVNLKGEV